jgi:Phycobilisome degradation protein nblA
MISPEVFSLTLPQQFLYKVQSDQVKNLSAEAAQDLLIDVLRQLMVKDNVIRHLLKEGL